MKDKQFKELLELNGKLVELGNNLVQAIEKYGKYSKYGKSPNMEVSVGEWNAFLKKNYIEVNR